MGYLYWAICIESSVLAHLYWAIYSVLSILSISILDTGSSIPNHIYCVIKNDPSIHSCQYWAIYNLSSTLSFCIDLQENFVNSYEQSIPSYRYLSIYIRLDWIVLWIVILNHIPRFSRSFFLSSSRIGGGGLWTQCEQCWRTSQRSRCRTKSTFSELRGRVAREYNTPLQWLRERCETTCTALPILMLPILPYTFSRSHWICKCPWGIAEHLWDSERKAAACVFHQAFDVELLTELSDLRLKSVILKRPFLRTLDCGLYIKNFCCHMHWNTCNILKKSILCLVLYTLLSL